MSGSAISPLHAAMYHPWLSRNIGRSSLRSVPAGRTGSIATGYEDGERADPFDLDSDVVTVPDGADARRRSGANDIARLEGHHRGGVAQQARDVEDEVG